MIIEMNDGFKLGKASYFFKRDKGWTRDLLEEVSDVISEAFDDGFYARESDVDDARDEGYREGYDEGFEEGKDSVEEKS